MLVLLEPEMHKNFFFFAVGQIVGKIMKKKERKKIVRNNLLIRRLLFKLHL